MDGSSWLVLCLGIDGALVRNGLLLGVWNDIWGNMVVVSTMMEAWDRWSYVDLHYIFDG